MINYEVSDFLLRQVGVSMLLTAGRCRAVVRWVSRLPASITSPRCQFFPTRVHSFAGPCGRLKIRVLCMVFYHVAAQLNFSMSTEV